MNWIIKWAWKSQINKLNGENILKVKKNCELIWLQICFDLMLVWTFSFKELFRSTVHILNQGCSIKK